MGRTVNASPSIPTISLSRSERWFGEYIEIELPREPGSPSESDLGGDCFWLLYKSSSEFVEPSPPPRQVNRRLLEWLRGQRSFEETRALTVANVPVSMKAAPAIWGILLQEEVVEEAMKREAEAEKLLREAEEKREEARVLRRQGTAFRLLGQKEEARKALQKARELLQEAREKEGEAEAIMASALQTLDRWAGSPIGQASIALAVQKGLEKAREEYEVMAGWGLEPGKLSGMDPRSVMELVRYLNMTKIRQIAGLAGRLRNLVTSARKQRVVSGLVPFGLARTHDLPDILPEELALLSPFAPGIIRARKTAEWAADGLPGIVRRGEAKEAGPFVAAVDVSGSMAGAREINAKAIAVALARTALEEGREFCLFSFSSASDPLIRVESEEIRKNPSSLLKWAAATLRGGTSFDLPLREAMRWIGEKENADLFFLSDGEAVPSREVVEEWEVFRREKGARLFYVAVNKGYGHMEKIADKVFSVKELFEEEAGKIAVEVGRWLR